MKRELSRPQKVVMTVACGVVGTAIGAWLKKRLV